MALLTDDTGLTKQDIQRLMDKSLALQAPDAALRRASVINRLYFKPTVSGVDKLPDAPTLFVGNHALFGIDILVFVLALHHETGRFARVLGDKFFFASPLGELLMNFGMVLADRDICGALMDAGEDLLVFPGGAAESTQPAANKYTLDWREHTGFVRMAAQHGYDIAPFGMVGPDDCYDHLLEGHQLSETRLGRMLGRWGLTDDIRADIMPPITRGMLGTQLPKPQPSFLAFGDPVAVPDCRGQEVPEAVLQSVQSAAAARIESLLSDMLLLRAQSADSNSLLRRLLLL